jgi:predicted kinase
MTTIYVLCGLPATGKSTWTDKKLEEASYVVCSTDNYLEELAKAMNVSYDDVFQDRIQVATKYMWQDFDVALSEGHSVIFDQTNLSVKKRSAILSKVPDHYTKIAVWFPKPDDVEWKRRLDSRRGKTIPSHIINSMEKNATLPTLSEGFDSIIIGA